MHTRVCCTSQTIRVRDVSGTTSEKKKSTIRRRYVKISDSLDPATESSDPKRPISVTAAAAPVVLDKNVLEYNMNTAVVDEQYLFRL